jgi:hypothetical protein
MPNTSDAILSSLIQKTRAVDPAIADSFIFIANELRRLSSLVDPAPDVVSKVSAPKPTPPPDVTSGTYTLNSRSVTITWEAPTVDIILYEVRVGSNWDTANRLVVTGTLSITVDPLPTGTTTYLIKALSALGIYSVDTFQIDVVVPIMGIFTITPSVINNFIALDWDNPSSTFDIDHYVITKDTVEISANVKSSFYSHQESAAGRYTYGVTAYDIYGNHTDEITVTVDVAAPTDFDIQDSQTSGFAGTIVNGKVDVGLSALIVCTDLTTTYQQHFVNNGWATPQAQVTAGYERWLEPMLTTASYEEVFDFGTIYQNVIVNLSWLFQTISGSFTFGLLTKVSDDNVTYTAGDTSSSFFVTSARYVKVKFTFTGANAASILAFSNFICTLNVKREVDGGNVSVFAADAAGTVVSFNKLFKFVESITVTPLDTNIRNWVYDFAGGTNPTSFKVKLWNAAGVRVNGTISWKARGVL